jgi:hypothetical protein
VGLLKHGSISPFLLAARQDLIEIAVIWGEPCNMMTVQEGDGATFVQRSLHSNRGPVMRPTNELHKHPAYAELQLSVSPAQFASIKRLGEAAFKDPLLVTQQGVIIDGYARKEYADSLGISTLLCVELDVSEEEALRVILNKHRRSAGWNDYNRIRMALRLKEVVRRRHEPISKPVAISRVGQS